MTISDIINKLDWNKAAADLDAMGYAVLPGVLTDADCDALIKDYPDDKLYRKKIVMEHHQYGKGEYKYFNYPLPGVIQQLRESVYSKLVPVANSWMEAMNKPVRFLVTLAGQLQLCHNAGQLRPTPLILKYEAGGFNALHQDLYGELFFPMQAVFFLNDSGTDFTGGEFVLIEQKPRAQSKAIVLNPPKGSMLVFTTSHRPVMGKAGYYRVNMKHGVSELHTGSRYTLGVIFHDAA